MMGRSGLYHRISHCPSFDDGYFLSVIDLPLPRELLP